MISRIKKNDLVQVLSGKDKGKQGVVTTVLPQESKVLVQNVGIVTKHVKARKAGDIAGIRKEETFIDMAKVMPVCSSCKKPSRINSRLLDTGKRVRACNRCEEIF
jgi:large subunit ribosomal protein L24